MSTPTSPAWQHSQSRPELYGATAEMTDHDREGNTPHAYGIHRGLQSALGTAYSTALEGLLHGELLAESRFLSGAIRHGEKLQINNYPSRADEALGYWVEMLRARVLLDDTDADIRRRCSARYKGSAGNDRLTVDAMIAQLLGPMYVAVHRQHTGDLDDPTQRTHWTGGNLGTSKFMVNGHGAWYSDRARIMVEVNPNSGESPARQFQVLTAELMPALDRIMPVWADFAWSLGPCFTLGVSRLGQAALCGDE